MQDENDFDYANYSSLIGLIYDAAQNPELWPELLEATGKHFASNSKLSAPINEEMLQPHFSRAIEINRDIAKLNAKNHTSNQILNRLPIGVIIVNKHAKNVAMNERALSVLNHGQTLCSKNDVIQTHCLQQTKELHQLIDAYASGNHTDKGASLLIRGSDDVSDTSLWITASDDQTAATAQQENVAIIYIASSLIQPEFDVQILQDNFDLTVAEARLVKTLLNGCHNLNDVAEKLAVSIHTVRTQCKRIFEKTGTSSQVELVKKVLTSPSALFGKAQPPRQILMTTKRDRGSAPEYCRFIRLQDGRRLSYEEYGDPEGQPVFMFHALFGSRLQYPAGETMAARSGLRFIVPDRPGHGYSDMQPERTLLDWPDDVSQLADHLELDKFSLLGYSGGGGYALACAFKIPQRIDQTVIVSSGNCFGILPDDGLSIDRFFLNIAKKAPALFGQFLRISTAGLLKDPVKALERRHKKLCMEDRQIIESDQANRAMYATSLMESIRAGSEGAAQDVLTIMKPWGFSPADIHRHIRLWHGEEDRQFPLNTAQQLADALPDCDATFVPNIGTMLILQHWDEILADLAEGVSVS